MIAEDAVVQTVVESVAEADTVGAVESRIG